MLNESLRKKYLSKFRQFANLRMKMEIMEKTMNKNSIANGLVRIDDCDNEDIFASRSFVSSKIVDSSRDSLDDTLQSQKEEVHEKLLCKLNSFGLQSSYL